MCQQYSYRETQTCIIKLRLLREERRKKERIQLHALERKKERGPGPILSRLACEPFFGPGARRRATVLKEAQDHACASAWARAWLLSSCIYNEQFTLGAHGGPTHNRKCINFFFYFFNPSIYLIFCVVLNTKEA